MKSPQGGIVNNAANGVASSSGGAKLNNGRVAGEKIVKPVSPALAIRD